MQSAFKYFYSAKLNDIINQKLIAMTTQHLSGTPHVGTNQLAKRIIFGAILGFIVISFFVFGVDEPRPEWGKYWMVRPLIVTPLAGAAALVLTYFIGRIVQQKALAIVLSAIVVVIALWLGIVLGLDGTMWN